MSQTPQRQTSLIGNFIRGALIGVVETIPGISGGTVALVVGIYHELIESASALIRWALSLVRGRRAEAREYWGNISWRLLIPLGIGMVVAVFTVAGPVVNLVETYPAQMRSIFFGMVAASVLVPLLMVRDDVSYRRKQLGIKHLIFFIVAAIVSFIVLSLPATLSLEPHWYIIMPAAAIAVSALVLPGLSGSLVLLTVGLYEPTLRAVEALDLGYIAVFGAGLVLGAVVIVQLLKWLLDHHHSTTLLVLSGVMLGALRALWPYQTEDGALQPIGDTLGLDVLLAIIGAVVVLILIWADRKMSRHAPQPAY
ncbi:MAG: DUF368 domain-containing protein [Yaniella sp.]|uniref:DUF368 domain-containing protein n=1 Tax=Yaniella sp. TaxID=2773929 RepID=UPI00264972CF|nr:DUF368 domain-containing protein [Yaniella sp.]MDN5704688.1 DUF368 domain-containing protein [Yaniella sp.]MDN5731934.1 DUF368 domain-containing protein [Yaniella sp.]MDN5742174.1 DUF368 domain-containing protein [Yaniella sp.]MDN5815229.1 DUF368 domain-containing protein [Yaniella sp.]MDN5818526.1 DUF368 domain-containing protein [Yaniella sp.]